jgi:hypothetical protein
MIKSVNTIYKPSLGQYDKNQSNTDIFRIGPIPVSPITARSESARRFDNRKEKSREILDWLINKGIITWCFSYWPSYRSSVWCIGLRLRLRPIQQASDLSLGQYDVKILNQVIIIKTRTWVILGYFALKDFKYLAL